MRKRYSDYDKREFAKWEDVVEEVTATVSEVREREMPITGDIWPVLYFPEEQFRFGVVLSAKINRKSLEKITRSKNPEDAVGVTVVLYNDPSQKNPRTGECGAVRLRAPVNGADDTGGATAKRQEPKPHPPVPIGKSAADINRELAEAAAKHGIDF